MSQDLKSDLTSPMGSRPWGEHSRGGDAPGMKNGIALGGGSEQLASPLNNPVAKVQTTPTPSGPVGVQVTEDVQAIVGSRGAFPSGT